MTLRQAIARGFSYLTTTWDGRTVTGLSVALGAWLAWLPLAKRTEPFSYLEANAVSIGAAMLFLYGLLLFGKPSLEDTLMDRIERFVCTLMLAVPVFVLMKLVL